VIENGTSPIRGDVLIYNIGTINVRIGIGNYKTTTKKFYFN